MIDKKALIQVFEHQRLIVGGKEGLTQPQLDALWRLNELHEFDYFKPIAKGIQFTQYVGVIQVDAVTIEILPKADKDSLDNDKTKWRNVLLSMLRKCGRLKVSTAGVANVNKQNLNLLEVYFELYLSELDQLLKRGLVKQYRKETKNVKALKGKLEFSGNIKHNLVHKERFYTTHEIYDTNHQLHQILNEALKVVNQFTRGTRLADMCSRVEMHFPEVTKLSVSAALLNDFKLTRKTEPYKFALEIARLILLNYSPDISAGKEKMLALLFDMNELWEEYITVMLRKYVQEHNEVEGNDQYEVIAQDSKPFWNFNRLKPDIVLNHIEGKKVKNTSIIDTKWKRPYNQSASVEDLRQMFAYNKFWKADKAMLLYPGITRGNDFIPFNEIEIPKGKFNINVKCKVEFVNVLLDEKLNINIGQEVFKLITKP